MVDEKLVASGNYTAALICFQNVKFPPLYTPLHTYCMGYSTHILSRHIN